MLKLRASGEQNQLPPGARILLFGPPLSFKTTSSMTWPKPIEHVSLPGEKGWETVPTQDPLIRSYYWEEDEIAQASPHAVIRDVEKAVFEIITKGLKDNGPRWTLVLEGLHKMYEWHRKARFLDLQSSASYQRDPDDEKIAGRAFGDAHNSYQLWLHRVLAQPVPYILGSLWEGRTKDDPENTAKKAPTHTFPDLPGQMANRIVGEFTITVFSEVSQPDPQGRQRGIWTLKPKGKIWGVGVHLPPNVAMKVPAQIVPKEWRACSFSDLEPYLTDPSYVDTKTQTKEDANGQ